MIQFTQFLRPNGRRALVTIERAGDVEADASLLSSFGARLEIEELRTGLVSIEILADNPAEPEEPHCLAHELVANGPGVPDAVDTAVRKALAESRRLGLLVESETP